MQKIEQQNQTLKTKDTKSRKAKTQRNEKPSFTKGIGRKSADLYKPALNKKLTTRE